MKTLPKARTTDIVIQNLKDEVLIYDLKTDHTFCLNETAAVVFNHCDGQTAPDNLKRRYKFTNDLIFFTLDELRAKNLLADEYVSAFAGMSRREVIKKVGLTTSALIALPLIMGAAAPLPNAAASSSCTAGAGGGQGNGDGCLCIQSGISNSYALCNTAGGSGNTNVNCKRGCICRVTDQANQCGINGDTNFCAGTCG